MEVYEMLEEKGRRGVETSFFELDDMLNGLQNGEMIIVAARPSMGKAQPLDANVLTTSGFKRMVDVRLGEQLASIDGQPSHVVGIYPQGQRQVYRITFADGRSTECCAEHLWRIHYRNWPEPRVVNTAKLMQLLQRKRYQNRIWIDTFAGEFGNTHELPLDAWLLGSAWRRNALGVGIAVHDIQRPDTGSRPVRSWLAYRRETCPKIRLPPRAAPRRSSGRSSRRTTEPDHLCTAGTGPVELSCGAEVHSCRLHERREADAATPACRVA